MNVLRFLPILALGTLSFQASAQIQTLYGGEVNGLLDRPELYDGLMIATALGPPTGHPLPGNPNTPSSGFASRTRAPLRREP